MGFCARSMGSPPRSWLWLIHNCVTDTSYPSLRIVSYAVYKVEKRIAETQTFAEEFAA